MYMSACVCITVIIIVEEVINIRLNGGHRRVKGSINDINTILI